MPTKAEEELLISLSSKLESFCKLIAQLQEEVVKASSVTDNAQEADYYNKYVITKMNELREVGDQMEAETSAEYWPYPSYADLLFSV